MQRLTTIRTVQLTDEQRKALCVGSARIPPVVISEHVDEGYTGRAVACVFALGVCVGAALAVALLAVL